jgi:hypothetical protein
LTEKTVHEKIDYENFQDRMKRRVKQIESEQAGHADDEKPVPGIDEHRNSVVDCGVNDQDCEDYSYDIRQGFFHQGKKRPGGNSHPVFPFGKKVTEADCE